MLTDFSALIQLPDGVPGFGYAQCASDGSDIYFKDADGNVLATEIDTWNAAGTSLIWVRVPSLTKTTEIAMYWGDAAKATAAKAEGQTSKVWNDNYMTVHHFSALDATEASGNLRGRFYDSAQETQANAAIYDTDASGSHTALADAKLGKGYKATREGKTGTATHATQGSKLVFNAVDDNAGWKQFLTAGKRMAPGPSKGRRPNRTIRKTP